MIQYFCNADTQPLHVLICSPQLVSPETLLRLAGDFWAQSVFFCPRTRGRRRLAIKRPGGKKNNRKLPSAARGAQTVIEEKPTPSCLRQRAEQPLEIHNVTQDNTTQHSVWWPAGMTECRPAEDVECSAAVRTLPAGETSTHPAGEAPGAADFATCPPHLPHSSHVATRKRGSAMRNTLGGVLMTRLCQQCQPPQGAIPTPSWFSPLI